MKKKLLIISLICFVLSIFIASFLEADDGDIPKIETRNNIVEYQLDTVKFFVKTKTCVITYRKVDSVGNTTGEEFDVIFMDVVDDPDTPEDETDNSFTLLISAINSGVNIKNTIKNATKIKLGL